MIDQFLLRVQCLPWDEAAATHFVSIAAELHKAGTPIVQAGCQKADGKTRVESAAALRGFHNMEGRLSAGAGVSSFQKTCVGMKMEVRDGNVHLNANCRKTSGESVPTSTILYDVHNMDGQLKHKVAGNDRRVV